jgi:hypothetical protein
VLENLKVIVETSDGVQTTVQEYAHNAISFSENKYAFCSEDPQLLIENIWEGKMTCLYVSFDILQAGLLENPLREGVENVHKTMQEIIERKDDELISKEKELVNKEKKLIDMHKVVEGKEKELIDMQIKMKRLQDELNLIKASRIYQKLLEKKIDKLVEELL